MRQYFAERRQHEVRRSRTLRKWVNMDRGRGRGPRPFVWLCRYLTTAVIVRLASRTMPAVGNGSTRSQIYKMSSGTKPIKTTTVAHPTTPKSNCAISLPARPSRIGASQADPKRSRERRLPPSISVALRPLFAAVPRIELLCAWAEQQNYELIRPLVLFGGPAAECAEETRAASERTLQRKAKRFRTGGVESLFGAKHARGRNCSRSRSDGRKAFPAAKPRFCSTGGCSNEPRRFAHE
jgi:hypothetical protein